MTYICYRGIEVSARMQYALLGIEVVDARSASRSFALVKVYTGGAPAGHSSRPVVALAVRAQR